jgi:flagellum-specific peptidoglycan hydrolase FlgJ
MPTPLYVHANDGTPVAAKQLEINGEPIYDASGKPYMVPFDFDWGTYLEKFKRVGDFVTSEEAIDRGLPDEGISVIRDLAAQGSLLITQFFPKWPGSPSDVQRTYNGYTGTGGGDFVKDFKPAASFLFGAACAASGLDKDECLAGAGAENIWSSLWTTGGTDTSGKGHNNPQNASNIESGWNFYKNSVSASNSASSKAKGYGDKVVHPTSVPVNKVPAPTAPTRSEQYGVPNPPGPINSGPSRLLQPPAPCNSLIGMLSPVDLRPFPDRPPFSPVSYPSPVNYLASPPTFFQGPYGSSYTPAGQAQERPAASPSAFGKRFYSLKDKLDFLGRVYRVAKPISDETGISLPFILAHAAHEVDFGKKIEGNNLFNIKADETWKGPTSTKGDRKYRSYPSYYDSMKDYLTYLRANPRFFKMFEPVTRQSLGRLVDAIHYAGYSDDPLYGPRILAASKDPMMKRALWQFEKWPPKATWEG